MGALPHFLEDRPDIQANFDALRAEAILSLSAGRTMQWFAYNQSWPNGTGNVNLALPTAYQTSHLADFVSIASAFAPIYFSAYPTDLGHVTVEFNNVSGGAFTATINVIALGA